MTHIRNMKSEDFHFAIDTANKEGWEYSRQDLDRLALAFPDGLFLAEDQNRRLGWVITCYYGNFAWVGSLVVTSAARGQGVGSALMQQALDYAKEKGSRTVALYAYAAAVPFYEAIGLREDCKFLLVQGTSKGGKKESTNLQKPRIDDILALDKKYFCGDRSNWLNILLEHFDHLFLSRNNSGHGYISGRVYLDGSAEIGPWICDPHNNELAESLLSENLSRITSSRISVIVPASNSDALGILSRFKFKVTRESTRMYMGHAEDLPRNDGIYAAAGWDIG